MAASAYQEVLDWLYALEAARGMDFKLERVELALQSLGNPQDELRCVHVAGTNGKGSVAAMAHSMLLAAGYTAGLYTSPHLLDFRERIRVGQAMISESEVVSLAHELRAAATVRGIELTFFEFTTVMALLHFARQGVDVAVIEVGLGGRLDATNVVEAQVAVITSIGLDHEEYLGSSLDSIAREKAGIIKPGQQVIVGKLPPPALDAVVATVDSVSARCRRLGDDFRLVGDGAESSYLDAHGGIEGISLGLRGRFQRDNAALAIAAVRALGAACPVPDQAIREGLATVAWPGRLEVVHDQPQVILDCAHNVDGIATLIGELGEVARGEIHLLFAVMRDKRWREMVHLLAPVVATATVTTVLAPRGESAERVASELAAHCPTRIAAEPQMALTDLIARTAPGDTILVTGSLFLVAAVRSAVSNQQVWERSLGRGSARSDLVAQP